MTVWRLRAFAAAPLMMPAAAHAGETARFLNAPATAVAPAVKVAVQYDLKLRLPQGRGLARLLLDAGVDRDDAAAAARLAAGHLGDGSGGCDVEVSITRAVGSGEFKLVRAMLMTSAGRTVIERRGAELRIASESAAARFPRLV
jgi:hypothetical protein